GTYRGRDRRRMVLLDFDREEFLESLRGHFTMSVSSRTSELLATRGDRLALFRVRWEGSDRSVGPSEIEWLHLLEVDDRGDRIAGVTLDPDALDAAYAELDDRYAAGEAASAPPLKGMVAFKRAFAARDWDALASM